MTRVSKEDFEIFPRCDYYDNTLNRHRNGLELFWFVGQCIQYHAAYQGGITNLAGELAARPDLFRDASDPILELSDRNSEVAANVFTAAIDEFNGQKTHRTMAKDTLRAIGTFFNLTSQDMNRSLQLTEATFNAINEVKRGYCVNQSSSNSELLSAIGFHIGSEAFADEEYIALDTCLRARHPTLVEYMHSHDAYAWISIHAIVEPLHFEASMEAANLAIKYHNGSSTGEEVRSLIMAGYRKCEAVKANFFKGLSEELSFQSPNSLSPLVAR